MGMEKHIFHGEIVEGGAAASAPLRARFEDHDTAKICDSMGGYGAMHYEIKPLETSMRFVGSALTVLTRPGDALYIQRAIDLTRPGDVIVVDAGGYRDVSVIGERLGYMFKRKGAVAIVIDGAVRDAQGMVADAPPTFSRGSCIRIFGSQGPGAINVPISCGGVPVHPGDIVVGDRDGVVVVPQADAERVADLADEHLARELERLAEFESGKPVTDVFNLDERTQKWKS